MPKRKRSRGSSRELGTNSPGSIAGLGVGEERTSQSKVAKLPDLPTSSKSSVASASTTESPGRRLLRRKRGYSVDFQLYDEDASRILPPMEALPSMGSLPSFENTSSSLLKGPPSVTSATAHGLAISALDQLDALEEEAGFKSAKIPLPRRKESLDENSNASSFASQSQQMLLEAFISYSEERYSRRDRLESWGGMSDLSANNGAGVDPSAAGTAAALAALEYTELAADAIAAAQQQPDAVPAKISLGRDRLLSVASGTSDISALLLGPRDGESVEKRDIHSFLQAEMADLATELESAAQPSLGLKDDEGLIADPGDMGSDLDSLLGAAFEYDEHGRPRSASVSSAALNITVDYDAVAAAVDVTEGIDLEALATGKRSTAHERARAAAGYLPPKRNYSPKTPVRATGRMSDATMATPKISNTTMNAPTPSTTVSSASSMRSPAARGQSSQKWEGMFDCLLNFIEHRRAEDTKGMTPQEIQDWVWDGNVPTTYRTPDGNALGRWVNNQRSAKSKGVLKEDREERLVQAGLKWSVLASNSWNEMLEELRVYVRKQTENGRKWDGNVPTNYQVKVKPAPKGKPAKNQEEDKNLGRWVNRQRSLYQAGRLRKDRQMALEDIGLRWSMLATTSWDSMFATLQKYVQERSKNGEVWDGNVPANFKTTDNPPRALGRWINRQRSAHVKEKLKPEYVKKLSALGLKWCVHERRATCENVISMPPAVPHPPPPQVRAQTSQLPPRPDRAVSDDNSADDSCVIVKTVPAKQPPPLTTPVRAVTVSKQANPGTVPVARVAGVAPSNLKPPPAPNAARKLAFSPDKAVAVKPTPVGSQQSAAPMVANNKLQMVTTNSTST